MSSDGHPLRWWILSAVAIGTVMAPLDGSIVSIALPSITAEFRSSLTTVEWVAAGYLLVISSLLLLWGRLADLYGHRPVYLTGFGIFALGSALCGAAGGIGWLIGFRMLQAAGAGMMMATGPAILADVFGPRERPRALGINTVVVALGLALGPVVGGLLTRHLGWRWNFYVNLPIAAVGMLWAARVLPAPHSRAGRPRELFDAWGALLLLVGLGSVLVAISQGERWGWQSWRTASALIGGLVGLVAFWAVERRQPSPLVDLGLFRDPVFVLANASGLLNFMAQFSVTFLMPFYLQNVLRLPADRAGWVMLGFPAALALSASVAGYVTGRLSGPGLAMAGMAVLGVGIWRFSQLTVHTGPGELFWRLALVGAGSGLFQTPNTDTVMGRVPRHRLGVTGGLWASMRNIGMMMGIALAAASFTARAGGSVAEAARDAARFLDGFRLSMRVGAGLALAGLVCSAATAVMARPAQQSGKTYVPMRTGSP